MTEPNSIPVIPGRQPVASPPEAAAPAQPPRLSLWRRLPPLLRAALIIGVIMAPVVAVVAALSSLLEPTQGTGTPSDPGRVSATISDCGERNGIYSATLTVTNGTNRERDITINVEWTSPTGTRLATDVVYVRDLAAGQTSIERSTSIGTEYGSTVRCSFRVR